MTARKQKIGFVLLGGIHHILHLIPPAALMSDHPDFEPVIFTRTNEEAAICEEVVSKLGGQEITIHILKAPSIATKVSDKIASLIWNIKSFQSLDAIVFAERTSTLLKTLPIKLPPFIHIPHGAGDRAKSYDRRIRRFDHVIVAGPKDKKRMQELGLVNQDNCTVSGYIKAAALKQIYPNRASLFPTPKPIVLYNPHFDQQLSSWPKFGQKMLQTFSQQTDFNFVFAPHIRLFANASNSARKELEYLGKADHIIVDLGSEKSTDMTYTDAADVYVGDVSSQVYEFLLKPKPCLFLTPENVAWEQDPDYAHWAYGPVENSTDDLLSAVKQSIDSHPEYKTIQIEGRNQALSAPETDAVGSCVKIIENILLDKL